MNELKAIEKVFHSNYREQEWELKSTLIPAIHLDEYTTEPGEEIPRPEVPSREPENMTDEEIEARYRENISKHGLRSAQATRRSNYLHRDNFRRFGTKRYRFQSLHRNPKGGTPTGFITKEEPKRPFGRVFSSQDAEWEFVMDYKERIFKQHGLVDDSPVEDKIKALADDIWQNRTRGRTIPHHFYNQGFPSDTMALKSHCPGSSASIVMLCATMNIPARRVLGTGHSMAEVFVNGEWCFVDNAPGCLGGKGGNAFIRKPFFYLLNNPIDHGLRISSLQRYLYWKMLPEGHVFEQSAGIWLMAQKDSEDHIRAQCIHLSPQTAEALYPGVEAIWYKSLNSERYTLMYGVPSGSQRHHELKLKQGDALCRKFWIGSLEHTKSILSTFYGSYPVKEVEQEEPGTPVRADWKKWFIFVNDKQYSLKDQASLQIEEAEDGWTDWTWLFEVPLVGLEENSYNTIGIGSIKRGDEYLWLKETLNAVVPPEACYCKGLAGEFT